jgi:threonine dehydrogenase-like Zn-dependent dehydrogenase
MGEVVEIGDEVSRVKKGQRVVVASPIGCGGCFFCKHDQWSLCDNSNPNLALEPMLGYVPAGIFGYSHAMGGYAGSHAEFIRVPYVDYGAFEIPESVPDEKAVFASDAVVTGYMASDNCDIHPGDVVAVWGCGGVGLMAIAGARILGAERIIAIDREPNRLRIAATNWGAECLNFDEVSILEALREMTGGRGPDACIDAVGLESIGTNMVSDAYEKVKQNLRLETDRGHVLRQAIMACRKGGIVSVPGVYVGTVDSFPMGAVMNKALTIHSGQQHGQKYIPRMLKLMEEEKLDPSVLITHRMSLDEAPEAYEIFRTQRNDCVRAVFSPHA